MSLAAEQRKGQELVARNKPGATKKLPQVHGQIQKDVAG